LQGRGYRSTYFIAIDSEDAELGAQWHTFAIEECIYKNIIAGY
jgi:hypothetical protein